MSTGSSNTTADRFLTQLVERTHLSVVSAERVRRVQQETLDRSAAVLLKLGLLSEAGLATEMAAFSGCALVGASESLRCAESGRVGVADSFLRAHELVPLSADEAGITVACWDALDEYAAKALAFACDRSITWKIASRSQIQRALAATEELATATNDAPNSAAFEDEEIERLKDLASEAPVIRLVQRVIDDAVRQKSSDIHLEASESALHVRFRLDGLLREVERHSKELAASVVSRIKVMAGLNIAERRL